MTDPNLSWDVILPERGARTSRATLHISSLSHGEESLSLPLSVGKRVSRAREEGTLCPESRAELLHRLGESARLCAKARVEALISRRDYSERDLREKLHLDGYTQAVVEEAVHRAAECGLVDDARFGAAFARSKLACGWGRERIERELSRHGVSPELIAGWPDDFISTEEERERALSLALRRRLTGKNDYEKIVRFLCGKGYTISVATDVAHEVLRGEN